MKLGMRRLAAITAGALAVALTIGTAGTAVAQDIDTSSVADLTDEQVGTILDVLGSFPVGSTADVIGSVGSADFPLGAASSEPIGTPTPVDTDIDATELIHMTAPNADGYEYWTVRSKAMQREIRVEVLPSKVTDQGEAPVLYLLDGVGAPYNSTGWAHAGDVDSRLEGENVHVVNPAGAHASYYTDWNQADPKLGFNKWETFLTDELPGIVTAELNGRAAEPGSNIVGVNGKSGIGGISMGGQAAMHLAATHPDLYDAVMSFSGYYSTMDALGYQTVRLSVETRGGDVENMWGPHGSDRWKENDTISHIDGLKGKAVYFSSGSGVIGLADQVEYGTNMQGLVIGLVLERGVLEGTKAFEKKLTSEGVQHKVDYAPTGLHNWPNFMQNFAAGWAHIQPALQG